MNIKSILAAFIFIFPNYSFGDELNTRSEIQSSLYNSLSFLYSVARFTANTPLANNENLSEKDVSEIWCIYQLSDNVMRNINGHLANRDSEVVEMSADVKRSETQLANASYRYLGSAETKQSAYDFSFLMDEISLTKFPILQTCRYLQILFLKISNFQ